MGQNGPSGRSGAKRDASHRASVATHPRGRFASTYGRVLLHRIQHEVTGGSWKTEYFETEEEARGWLAEALD